jgi:hypothetical protein
MSGLEAVLVSLLGLALAIRAVKYMLFGPQTRAVARQPRRGTLAHVAQAVFFIFALRWVCRRRTAAPEGTQTPPAPFQVAPRGARRGGVR